MSKFPDTNPSAIAAAGYKEIAPGVWLEAGAIDAFGAFVFLPAWVRDPGGRSWAEALG